MDAVPGGLGLPKIHREHHRASVGNVVSDGRAACLASEQMGLGRGEELVESPAFPALNGQVGRVRGREQGEEERGRLGESSRRPTATSKAPVASHTCVDGAVKKAQPLEGWAVRRISSRKKGYVILASFEAVS